jgi:phosphate/sulfate permease
MHTELFAVSAVIICGAVEFIGHSIFGLNLELTVGLGIITGSILAIMSLIHEGRKMFRALGYSRHTWRWLSGTK